MHEFELKFQVPPGEVEAVEKELRRGNTAQVKLRARYFDTPDEALARHGLVLRLRQEGRQWVQAAKGPGRGGFERLEHEVPLSRAEADAGPDIGRHAGHPVHGLLVQAMQQAQGALLPVFQTDIDRVARILAAGSSTVEIALDRGCIRAGTATHPVSELEIELKQGAAFGAIELARHWCAAHGLWLDPRSKAATGWQLAHGVASAPAARTRALDEGGRQLLAALLDSALQQSLANAREVAAGTGGTEHVHQLRVGLRRLRSAMRELRACGGWEAVEDRVEPVLAALFTRLGEHRDRSLLIPSVVREMAAHGSPLQAWEPELPDIAAAVREPAVQDAWLELAGLVRSLQEGEGVRPRALRAVAGERLGRLFSQVLKAGRRFQRLPAAKRHRARKRLKRLRYLAELVRPAYRHGPVDDFVDALKELQDALGRYQDIAAAQVLLRERAQADPAAWFGVGWLAAREEEAARDCASACRRMARKARPFWD